MVVGNGQYKWDVKEMMQYLLEQRPRVLIYEGFMYRNRSRAGLELFSRELIGVIKLYGATDATCEVIEQSPSYALAGHWTDKNLKEAGVYAVANPHANDATRHLLQWYSFGPGYRFNSLGFRPA